MNLAAITNDTKDYIKYLKEFKNTTYKHLKKEGRLEQYAQERLSFLHNNVTQAVAEGMDKGEAFLLYTEMIYS